MKRIKLERIQHQGFTLIELMITLTIVAMLATQATPLLMSNIIRNQVSEGAGIAQGLQVAVISYYKIKGAFPNSPSDLGYQQLPGSTFAALNIAQGGVITVTYGNTWTGSFRNVNGKIQAAVITYTPQIDTQGHIFYTCTIDNSYLKQNWLISQCSQGKPPSQTPNDGNGTTTQGTQSTSD